VKGPDEVAAPNAGLPLTAGGSVAPFDLDGVFAPHPGLIAHAGPWAAGDLAVVHAVGMPAAESDTQPLRIDAELGSRIGVAVREHRVPQPIPRRGRGHRRDPGDRPVPRSPDRSMARYRRSR
jgi:hypothetical protein